MFTYLQSKLPDFAIWHTKTSGIEIQTLVSATAIMVMVLIVCIVLSLAVVVAILPVHQASAKECNSDDNNKKNNNKNDDTHSITCKHDQQDSNNHDHSTSITKDKTPFILSLPFP
jgi:uncharacterized membrane protein YhiD involved in acid resistance